MSEPAGYRVHCPVCGIQQRIYRLHYVAIRAMLRHEHTLTHLAATRVCVLTVNAASKVIAP